MDPLPPDPYLALGLAKDVDIETIKKTYRKLVLKCHPDKVTDPSLKLQKQEEFHKIQQAYELVGEEEARARYDAEVKLEALRKEKAARGASGSGPDIRTARYDATGPARYDDHKSSRHGDDRYYEDRSRRYDTYEAYPPKQTTSRSSREKVSPQKTTRESSDRTRSDYKKHVATERERESDHSADEKARYEAERAEEDEARKAAADLRRKAEDRRSYEDKYDRKQKLSAQENDAVRYIRMSAKGDAERPSPNVRDSRDYYDSRDSRSRRDRPEAVRRSSARPRDRHSPPGRDRKAPEIVDWEPEERKIPAFKHSSSSPAEIHVPRVTPHRSYTESSRDHRRSETSPTPMFRRSETMPSVPQASPTSRKTSTVPRPSGLRESVTPHDSGSSSPEAYPTIPPPASTKRYYYPTPGGGVSLAPEDMGLANGHRTVLREPVLREPERQRHRSPSPLTPLTRPPMGANRPSEASSARYTAATPSKSSVPPPPLGRSATTMNMGEDRGRSRPLYGEIGSDAARRENARRQTSFSPDKVSYSRKIGPEDVRWAPQSGSARDRDRDYQKPALGRHATYVF
ncbi:DnaJ-domain-containing protein [Paraphaeosphaeria sporulosa]|uniref:DnaJ-domain-containing protein n=1 Tax=Paraphaeosphaeria sporulosa TaxID=1460663 RepID=A0A177CZ36_9PLEO|nr:DnaJ-domain-containing protein [Paraphaeosphaeria sporulosa]OAG12100.1 DnaJ-domain-containing protein [Paraphaeosphaeria sporulosa]